MTGWEASEVALVTLAVFAPAALVTLVAVLRGYNVAVWRRPESGRADSAPDSESES